MPCGTAAAYHRHRYHGEEPCPEDRAAVAADARQRLGLDERSRAIPARILDLLDLDNGWLTVDGIALDLGVHPESARRALYRLRALGKVDSRVVYLARLERGGYDSRLEWRLV